MASEPGFFVGPKQIDEWEAQITVLQRRVAAAKELLCIEPGKAPAVPTQALEPTMDAAGSFMGTMVKILHESPAPISRNVLRDKMTALGFGEDKMKYFNTVLYKTMKAQRTQFLPNGKVWKGNKR